MHIMILLTFVSLEFSRCSRNFCQTKLLKLGSFLFIENILAELFESYNSWVNGEAYV